MIHPTAIIHPKAKLDSTVRVGPYAIIDEDVTIGPNCIVGPHVYLTGCTIIGEGNRFYAGCVVGEASQDLKYKGEPTSLQIGDDNTFREHVTVNRSSTLGKSTIIGSHNVLMTHCHVGHDCVIKDRVILVNGSMLGGHVSVDDSAIISGNCMVHQFVRVGTLAMMQGASGIGKDLPPFTVARGVNRICGLKIIGLRRAGFTSEQRLELRRLYHAVFRSGQNLRTAVSAAEKQFTGSAARTFLEFVAASKRGICAEISSATPEAEEGE